MQQERMGLDEELITKLTRKDVLLILLCISITCNHTQGGRLLYDLECLREKIVIESGLNMFAGS